MGTDLKRQKLKCGKRKAETDFLTTKHTKLNCRKEAQKAQNGEAKSGKAENRNGGLIEKSRNSESGNGSI